jgi:hypothetical protein
MTGKALLPVTESLSAKAESNPDSPISVQMRVGDSITGAARTTLIEEVKGMVQAFSQSGGQIRFRVKGRRLQDLPQPEGVQYDIPARACTQVVIEMVHPETGERRTATDGCEAGNLREQGFVPVSPGHPGGTSPGGTDPGTGTGGGADEGGAGPRQAGLPPALAIGAGAVLVGGLAWASCS